MATRNASIIKCSVNPLHSITIRTFNGELDVNDVRWLTACRHVRTSDNKINAANFTIETNVEEDEHCIPCQAAARSLFMDGN